MVPSPTAPTPEAVSESLMPAVGAVRRLLRRLAGPVVAAAPFEVSPAQREVLLVVGKRAGRSVAEIADELGLAPNTVSTIVTQLVGAGLLVRETDPQDRRVGRLRLTASAQEALDAARARRRGVLHEALGRLGPRRVAELAAGIDALEALAEELRALERER
ncbi:MAG TPA: MarR family transcriptional regulator [Pseudonocardia sp.]|jgi:DNA-binding MarR family transcriptional regulator|uniref:MarR family winged helix-turn-helix transcriptional regulator n=1 Tax=Pseudonocardia sp. TaxID=60912 RepID=UPI002B4B0E30|nr:MarR family transcriptional regulator [Pseudonocardia sp.]HLU59092.1 MarR family transcriptional regulator [Pseudonocardia sp.]